MLKRILSLLIVCLVITGAPVMRDARADIPAGVRIEYQYNQKDSSIIIVKKCLQELGYFKDSVMRKHIDETKEDCFIPQEAIL